MQHVTAISATLLFLSSGPVLSAQKLEVDDNALRLPKWEIAIGLSALTIPYYRGSAENENLTFPVVVPIYRGEHVQIDRRGIRGLLFRSDRWALDLSADANVPADAEDLEIRAGMPDLEPSIQIGPSLRYTLFRDETQRRRLRLNLPLRAVFALDSGADHIGYTFSPSVTYGQTFNIYSKSFRWSLYAGLEFGSNSFHDYFYSVDEEFERPQRPAYNAESGFGGYRFGTALRRRVPRNLLDNASVSVFARYDRVDNASFEDSPLVDSRGGLTAGVFLLWTISKSKDTVAVDPF